MAVGIPNFPTSLDAASDLVEATNNASTTINMVGGLSNSATTITVVSTAAFPSTGIIRIDDELISYSAKTSTTFTVQTRGFESTTAASHIDGATVSLDITAASNNAKNTAIIALETKVGTGSSTPTANTVLRGTGTGTTAFGQVGLTTDVTGTLPAANGGTGITSLGANVATFLGTPSSANLASAVTDETGSGALVFGTSPSLTTPGIGSGGFTIAGSSSGTTTVVTSATASGTVTIPAGTATLATTLNAVAFKNVLINGDMQVAQRGTSFTSTGGANNDTVYTLDRWKLFSDGNNAVDVTRATDAPAATTGQYTKRVNSIRLDVKTVNKKFGIAQIIERRNCEHMIGSLVSLSFKARVSSTTKLDKIRAAVLAWSSTEDSVTNDIVSAWNNEDTNPTFVTNLTLENIPATLNTSTSWTSYTIENIAIDTANTTNIIVFIWSDVTDTTLGDFLYITDVQLEPGSSATPYEYLPIDVQLTRCQRYFHSMGGSSASSTFEHFALMSLTSINTQCRAVTFVPVPMRVVPSIGKSGDFDAIAGSNSITTSGATITNVSQLSGLTNLGFDYTLPTGLTFGLSAGAMYILRANNSTATRLTFSAEL